jgi:hypothetical protein
MNQSSIVQKLWNYCNVLRDDGYDELIARDKASLDIFWLKDVSLEDTENLPAPGLIAAEIMGWVVPIHIGSELIGNPRPARVPDSVTGHVPIQPCFSRVCHSRCE